MILGDKENTVFGIVNRPAVANPQFSEVQSTDQTSNKASFETERVLLRLERQKKPETPTDTKIGDIDYYCKITRPPRLPILSKSIIVPSLAMVDQMDVLKILVQIYCAFIDNNLILNPMTEMYFILSLITTQYFHKQTPRKCAVKESPNTSYSLKSGELKQKDLEIDLGCAVLTEEASEEDNLAQTEDRILFLEENIDKFNKLTIDEKTVINQDNCKEVDDITSNENFQIDDLYLGTPHNCVFFSTHVLNQERHWLKFLDRATLKLLSENSHIIEFQPELQIYLQGLYDMKLSEMNRTKQQIFRYI